MGDDDDEDHDDDDGNQHKLHALNKDGLRVQVAYIPQMTLTLPEKPEWSDKFAQLCVRCYRRRRRQTPAITQQQQQEKHDGYVIHILHPQHMMQYFAQEQEEEESMRLDDEDEHAWMDPLLVSITISKSEGQKFRVNQNEWPIRSWTITSEEEEQDEDEDEDDMHQEKRDPEQDDDDIFVDGMEELAQESHVTNSMQAIASLPSSSTLIQTLQNVNSKETANNDKNTIPHSLVTQQAPVASVPEEETPTDSNKV